MNSAPSSPACTYCYSSQQVESKASVFIVFDVRQYVIKKALLDMKKTSFKVNRLPGGYIVRDWMMLESVSMSRRVRKRCMGDQK